MATLGTAAAALIVEVPIQVAAPIALLGASVVVALLIDLPGLPLAILLLCSPVLLREVGGGVQVVHVLALGPSLVMAFLIVTGRGRLRPHPILLAGGAYILVLILATALSGAALESLQVLATHLVGFALACSVAFLAARERGTVLWMSRCWSLGALGVLIPAITSAGDLNVRFGGSLVEGRVSGTFTQPNEFGEFAMLTAAVGLLLVVVGKRRFDKLLATVTILAALMAMLASLSRGTWLGMILAVLVLILLVPRWTPYLLGAPLVGMVMVAAAALVGNTFSQGLLARSASILSESGGNPSDGRDVIYAEAWRLWSNNQWFGAGPGQYAVFTRTGDSLLTPDGVFHAHNILLHVGTEAGLLGAAALLLLAVTCVAAVVYRRRSPASFEYPRTAAAVLLAALVGVAGHGIIDYVYTSPVLVLLLWVVLGMLAAATSPLSAPPDPEGTDSDQTATAAGSGDEKAVGLAHTGGRDPQ